MAELAAYLFLVSLLGMGLLGPAALRLGRAWGVLDHPGPRKVHGEAVPLTGGWAIFAVLTVVLWGHLALGLAARGTALAELFPIHIRRYLGLSPALAAKLAGLYAGALFVFVLGLVDDVRGLSVRKRLVFQTAVAVALVAWGLRPNLGFLPPWMAGVIGVVWIVGIMNAFNFLDGLDGLSGGVAFIASSALLVIGAMGSQPIVTFFVATFAGTTLGFLRYNYHPARVFLGSSGSLLIGYLMAVSTLLVSYVIGHGGNWIIPIFIPIFILAVPLYDTASVVLVRLFQRRNIAVADQSHFHHRLMRLGFGHLQTVCFIHVVALCMAASAVLLARATPAQSALILVQIGGIFSVLVMAERFSGRAPAFRPPARFPAAAPTPVESDVHEERGTKVATLS